MSERDQAIIAEWTLDTFDAAVHAVLVTPPWRPTDHAYGVLRGYREAGLTPAEAAQAFFSTRQ